MNHLSYVEISIYHPELYLTSLIIYGRRPSVLSDREMVEYTKGERGVLCVYNDKEVSKVTLDRSSPRIINGKSLIMTLQYILIPDPIQFYNNLIRIVSLSLVDAFLCHIIFFIKDAAIFIKLFTSIDSQHLLILLFSFFFFGGDVLLLHSTDFFSCSAKCKKRL